jgi:hypothetical protein
MNTHALVVKNIPADWQVEKLKEKFNMNTKNGKVVDVKLTKEKFAFVFFDTEDAVNEWVDRKYLVCEDDVVLDLGKGERNCSLFVCVRTSVVGLEMVKENLEKKYEKISIFEIQAVEKSKDILQLIVKLQSKTDAESAKNFIEKEFGEGVEVVWADRDQLPIALHLTFNVKNEIGFNKDSCEKFFLDIQEDENNPVLFSVDLPRERKSLYKGYGTLTYEISDRGLRECSRILSLGNVKISNVVVKLTQHRKSKMEIKEDNANSLYSSCYTGIYHPFPPSFLPYNNVLGYHNNSILSSSLTNENLKSTSPGYSPSLYYPLENSNPGYPLNYSLNSGTFSYLTERQNITSLSSKASVFVPTCKMSISPEEDSSEKFEFDSLFVDRRLEEQFRRVKSLCDQIILNFSN